jgi:signal transduction histidine kinase
MKTARKAKTSSIAKKLIGLNTLVSGAALVLACIAFATYDRTTSRAVAVQTLSVQAQIVGANSVSALLFNDPETAGKTLSALQAARSILSAAIYTSDGGLFASYQRDDATDAPLSYVSPSKEAEVRRVDSQQITLVRRIVFQGRPVGSVSIQSDMEELDARQTQYVGMIASVLLASLIAASLMSWVSQRRISTPIVQLAEVARAVSDGKDYSVRASATARNDEIGTLTEAFNDMLVQIQERDTSLHEAQHALEARVLDRTAELEAVNKELEAFSYSVSHDLRAPLRHIAGFAGMLHDRAKAQLDDQSHKHLEKITQAATRMGQLIDDLLAFSRIGRGQLAIRTVRLGDLVREALVEVTTDESVARRQIDWRIGELPDVHGDPAMLRLVMINLLSNAVKYSSSREKSCIEIDSRRDPNGDTVVFIRDNGVGFDMQYVHKLFGVFQRLHSSDEFEGTGIGLANVRRLVHRHGGRVWAEGEIDRGATFYFSLPPKDHKS